MFSNKLKTMTEVQNNFLKQAEEVEILQKAKQKEATKKAEELAKKADEAKKKAESHAEEVSKAQKFKENLNKLFE